MFNLTTASDSHSLNLNLIYCKCKEAFDVFLYPEILCRLYRPFTPLLPPIHYQCRMTTSGHNEELRFSKLILKLVSQQCGGQV